MKNLTQKNSNSQNQTTSNGEAQTRKRIKFLDKLKNDFHQVKTEILENIWDKLLQENTITAKEA